MILRTVTPAIFVPMVLGVTALIVATSASVERTALWLLTKQFQWWYLIGYGAVFAVFCVMSLGNDNNDDEASHWMWAVAAIHGAIVLFIFFLNLVCQICFFGFFFHSLALTFPATWALLCFCAQDAIGPFASPRVRLAWLVLALLMYCYPLVVDIAGTSMFRDQEVCVLYCSTTRKVAYAAMVQVTLFLFKYFCLTVKQFLDGQQAFVVTSLPVKCIWTAGNLDPFTGLATRVVHLSTKLPSSILSYADVYRSPSSFVNRSFAFQPVISWVLARRAAQHRYYKVYVGISIPFILITIAVANVSGQVIPELFVLDWLLAVVIVVLELTRLDRTLMHCVLRKFEWWVLTSGGVIYLVFGMWSTIHGDSSVQGIIFALTTFAVWGVGLFGLSFVDGECCPYILADLGDPTT
jgi:hypothetical protein